MAKTKVKAVALKVLSLNYQLAELSSSQHRAGLAGLVLIVQWLERQPEFKEKIANGAICQITELSEQSATLEINQAGLEALFDEIYAASTEEQARSQLLKHSRTKATIEPLREEEREETDAKGKTKTKKVYIYPVVVPGGSFLADSQYDRSSDGRNGCWIKLWRDMLWSILRGVPATRKPFEARAEGAYTEDAAKVWKDLIQPETFTVDLPSTYFLGAQAFNAETVPFKDRAQLQFLLHFWIFAAQIYVPAIINNEGDRDFVGYAIAIPDVANLEGFCDELPFILSDRSPEISGYRPRDAVVDLAIEGALNLMHRLRDRLTIITGEQFTADLVMGVDVIHAEKQGNNVRILGSARLDPDPPMVNDYVRIREGYWSPLFRRQRLLNLVNHQPWYMGFDKLLCSLSDEQSIGNNYFRRDTREAFQHEEKLMTESATNDAKTSELVFQFVRTYVGRKLKSKYQLEWSEVKDKPDKKKEYEEKREKIAKDAFLAVRSRTEQMDFINYFVSTLCSVPQHIKPDDYLSLTQVLYQDTDRIRTLTLLALSANS